MYVLIKEYNPKFRHPIHEIHRNEQQDQLHFKTREAAEAEAHMLMQELVHHSNGKHEKALWGVYIMNPVNYHYQPVEKKEKPDGQSVEKSDGESQ